MAKNDFLCARKSVAYRDEGLSLAALMYEPPVKTQMRVTERGHDE
jgi:hypothetical protein